MIYLFANNSKINEEYIKNLNITDKDIFMFFNHCLPLDETNIYVNNEKIILLRKNHYDTYWGIDKLSTNKNKFSTIYFIGPHIQNFNYDNYNNNYIIYNHKLYFEDNDKMPTTGFIGYTIAKKYYPNYDIVLVGFDAPYNDKYYKWDGHNHNYEYDIYQSNNIMIV